MTRTLTVLAPLAGAAAAALLAAAPESAQAQALGDWSFQITPYVWFEGINGDITPGTGAPPLEIDASFTDILEDLNSAFFLHGLARSGDFVLFFDLSTSSSSRGGLVPPGIPAEGSLSQTSLTLAGGYRVVDNPQGHFDILAGARAWWIEAEVDVPLAGLSATPAIDFVDPIIGARAHVDIAPGWSATLYGDVGGFGVGSEMTSQFFGTVNYALTEQLTVSAGYRTLNVDYRDGGVVIDATMSGPILGVTWAF